MAKIKLAAKVEAMAKTLYSFRFDPEMIKEIEKLAKKEHRNLTNFIETLFIQKIEEAKTNKKK